MKRIKKILPLLLALALCIGCCSCTIVTPSDTATGAASPILYQSAMTSLHPDQALDISIDILMSDSDGEKGLMSLDIKYVAVSDETVAMDITIAETHQDDEYVVHCIILDGRMYAEADGEKVRGKADPATVTALMSIVKMGEAFGVQQVVLEALGGVRPVLGQDDVYTIEYTLADDDIHLALAGHPLFYSELAEDMENVCFSDYDGTLRINMEHHLVSQRDCFCVTEDGESVFYDILITYNNPGQPVQITPPEDVDEYINADDYV